MDSEEGKLTETLAFPTRGTDPEVVVEGLRALADDIEREAKLARELGATEVEVKFSLEAWGPLTATVEGWY